MCDTGELGGWIESEQNLSQEGNARVYSDARVYGDARVCGDKWDSSPLQIQGSKFFLSVSSKDSITVGCQTKSISEWAKSYKAMFARHNFTQQQQLEYILYFNLASRLYGWDIQLPTEDYSVLN